jgi:hypothetical protein
VAKEGLDACGRSARLIPVVLPLVEAAAPDQGLDDRAANAVEAQGLEGHGVCLQAAEAEARLPDPSLRGRRQECLAQGQIGRVEAGGQFLSLRETPQLAEGKARRSAQ